MNPWAIFSVICGVNIYLTYTPLPFGLKLGLGTALFLGLGVVSLKKLPKAAAIPPFPWEKESLGTLPPWAWIGLVSFALVFRFWDLTSYLGFPIFDEVINAFYALRLDEHWDWHSFFFTTQLPPFYIWLLALAFKVSGCSLLALWLVPALLSFAAFGFSYFTARNIFSRSLSFFFAWFTAVGFWPVYLGRFSHQAVLMLFWEFLALFLLGRLFRSAGKPSGIFRFALLGLVIGTGFYTYFAWDLVAVPLTLIAVALILRSKPSTGLWKGIAAFTSAILFPLIPLLSSMFDGGYGHYFLNLLVFHPPHANNGWDLAQSLHYFSVFFWETFKGYFSYGPAWGGLFNPIQSGFIFLGLLEFIPYRRHLLVRGTVLAALFCFLPILFTNVFNTLRLTPLVPLGGLLLAFGFLRLVQVSHTTSSRFLLALLMLFSMGMDTVNLQKSAFEVNHNYPAQKPPVYVEAYRILDQWRAQKGPGLVFSNFVVNEIPEPFLPVADFSFNAVENPRLDPDHCSWVAVLTNVHYKPFLDKRFPGARSYWLNKDQPPSDRDLMLWLVDLAPGQQASFRRWIRADWDLQPFVRSNFERTPQEPLSRLLEPLARSYPSFQGDPFLEASYWERVANLYFNDLMLRSLKKSTGQEQIYMPTGLIPMGLFTPASLQPPIQALQNAVQRGYPAAHLYYRLGVFFKMAGQEKQARACFQKAVKAPLDFTGASKYLRSAPASRQNN